MKSFLGEFGIFCLIAIMASFIVFCLMTGVVALLALAGIITL